MGMIDMSMVLQDEVSPKLTKLQSAFAKFNKTMQSVEKHLKGVQRAMAGVEKRFDSMNQKMVGVNAKLDRSNSQFERMRGLTQEISKNIANMNRNIKPIKTNGTPVTVEGDVRQKVSSSNKTKTPESLEIPDLEDSRAEKPKKGGYFVGSLMGNLIATGAYNLLGGLKNISVEAVDTASALVEVQNVLDTVFSPEIAGTQVEQWAKQALDNYGLVELQAKEFVGTMGAILSSSIPDKNLLSEMSISLASLAGDIASFNNLDPQQAFDKLRAGMVGETEPLRDLGINMTVAALDAYALQKGLNMTTKEMNAAQQAMLRYSFILDHTTNQQGDFAKTSQEFANRQRVLSGVFKTFTSTLASALLPILSELYGVLINLLRAITPVIQKFADWVVAMFEFIRTNELAQLAIKSLMAAVIALAIIGLGRLILSLGRTVIAKLQLAAASILTNKILLKSNLLFAALGAIVGYLYFALQDATWGIKMLAVGFLIAAGAALIFFGVVTLGIGFIVAGIVLLILWLIKAWQTNEEFRFRVLKALVDIRYGWDMLVAGVSFIWGLMLATIGYGWNRLVTEIVLGVKWLGVDIQNFCTSIQMWFIAAGKNIRVAFNNVINDIIKGLNWVIEKLNMIPGVNIPLFSEMQIDTSEADAKLAALDQKKKDRDAAFNAEAESRRQYDKNQYMDKIKGVTQDFVLDVMDAQARREEGYKWAENLSKIQGKENGGLDINSIGGANPDYLKIPKELFDQMGGGDNKKQGKDKVGKVDKVDKVGKIEEPIEVDAIEVLVELARDRYGRQYNTISPNISISINGNGDQSDAEAIAQRISIMMEESIAKMM